MFKDLKIKKSKDNNFTYLLSHSFYFLIFKNILKLVEIKRINWTGRYKNRKT